MPTVVVGLPGGGWVMRVPLCDKNDAITGFNVSKGERIMEAHSLNPLGSRRVVTFVVDAATIKNGKFSPEEVFLVGDILSMPTLERLGTSVITDRGSSEFQSGTVVLKAGSSFVVRGRSRAVTGDLDDTALLLDWCGSPKP